MNNSITFGETTFKINNFFVCYVNVSQRFHSISTKWQFARASVCAPVSVCRIRLLRQMLLLQINAATNGKAFRNNSTHPLSLLRDADEINKRKRRKRNLYIYIFILLVWDINNLSFPCQLMVSQNCCSSTTYIPILRGFLFQTIFDSVFSVFGSVGMTQAYCIYQ